MAAVTEAWVGMTNLPEAFCRAATFIPLKVASDQSMAPKARLPLLP